ncbi:hypothetical protein MAR_009554 [Mya arenaria]|uniref:Uncharacterized protein n=1 Tax=Mya arenaria TaxID=6604 RepID=A0ABY7E774_MYAAR|nr:hypothetical protein MAR_009554 [Mya arenaria]
MTQSMFGPVVFPTKVITLCTPALSKNGLVDQYISVWGNWEIPISMLIPRKALISAKVTSSQWSSGPFCAIFHTEYALVCATRACINWTGNMRRKYSRGVAVKVSKCEVLCPFGLVGRFINITFVGRYRRVRLIMMIKGNINVRRAKP